jgi:uncharacterized lipoprotein YajG
MKFNLLGKISIILASLALLAGCGTLPVHNVNNSPVLTMDDKPVTMKEVKNAILRSGIELGWVMRPISEGKIQATINLRKHSAEANITYDKKAYSITYVSSSNLKYSNGNIHKNYNGWIQNLDKRIRGKISGITLDRTYAITPLGIIQK